MRSDCNRRSDSRVDCVKWVTGYDKVATGLCIENMRRMIKLCNWYVIGLNRPGKLRIHENTIKNSAVTGVSETHRKTTGHFTTTNGHSSCMHVRRTYTHV